MDFIYCLISGICFPSNMSRLFALVQGKQKNSLQRWPMLTHILWLESEPEAVILLPQPPFFNALPQHLSPLPHQGVHRDLRTSTISSQLSPGTAP